MSEIADRIKKLESDLASTRNSAAFLVGTAMLAILKDPRRSLVAVRNLVRLWRMRGTSSDKEFSTELGEPLLGRVRPPAEFSWGIRVALIGTEQLANQLADSCYVIQIMPHDSNINDVLLPFKPDIFLVQASVGQSRTPWQHLGNPLAADRSTQLARLVKSANLANIPVVIWADITKEKYLHALSDLEVSRYLYSDEITSEQLLELVQK